MLGRLTARPADPQVWFFNAHEVCKVRACILRQYCGFGKFPACVKCLLRLSSGLPFVVGNFCEQNHWH